MLAVIREEGETIDHLLRRYNDKLRRVHFVEQVKGRGFFSKRETKRERKLSALYKLRRHEKMDYLKRIGKVEERGFEYNYYSPSRPSASSST
ncbi:MAG: hypothetical protein A2445_02265 [Candidatus Jacksonbacteria bacterium RIFOXYC2_FULL_44_29]|nr:MAG: hypothetical protein UW45_C0016G0007 [Parcubacteria group bacterium GW2011_GWC2_44_22]OGY75483.1 MAG: hypothetical protein A2240_03145 [Candidatus Jacksonbacteria bacterium RIFOXYA2_FULL_43_12]OGY76979.1 MAG: hypothetical protein A2295_01250 [Candidatus Jacksonbacteria bacterium RIFOXYB2_FULL_44_15]OGY77831.1 MAG: hypothetical protein A2445_02265 [Candidatus Jacksonbacteria bacterium RIFOXYC2_FULL_44_29]OGY80248.1 MAG: hypothetical protein A2550_03915 [Candidatus Jacksonbacteria bacteri